jgi:hypothetical protein
MNNKLLDYSEFLSEGLISTYPISIYQDTLLNNLSFLNDKDISYHISINYNNETFNIKLSKIFFDDVIPINSICNNLGYFITKFKIYRNNKENIIKYNSSTFEYDIQNNDGLILYYESKFDTQANVPNKIYHTTNVKNIEKILKNGLYPKSTSKLEYHYERIYFYENVQQCIGIIKKLIAFDNTNTTLIKDYLILEIDTTNFNQMEINGNISNVKFYLDSKSSGFYTYHNISKNRLKLMNTLYTEYGVINFDKYVINSIKNPIYMEFYLQNESVYQLERIKIKNN